MSGWAVGDLAVCVGVRHPRFRDPSTTLVRGRVYRVERVGRPIPGWNGERALGLVGAAPRKTGRGWPQSLFRKILPADPAFAEQMRAIKPRVTVDA